MDKKAVADVIEIVKNYPYLTAQDVGFSDVRKKPHNDWMKHIICDDGDYTLLAHRGSYKSSVLSVCIALLMLVYPQKNIIFLRKADNDVSEMIRMVRKALESDIFRKFSIILYKRPIVLDKVSASEITTNLYKSASGSSQLLGIGIKSSITGKHADIVITDDICNISDRISKAERDRTKLQYQELQNIRNRGGRIINTGTKWHSEDVFSLIDDIDICDCYHTGLIPPDKLQAIKDSMIPSLFACNYELRIIASEDVIFTDPQTGAGIDTIQNGIMHLDSAFYGEDFTAWGVMAKHDGKYYLYGKCRRNHVEDCYGDIMADYSRFCCGKLYNESNADKGFVAKELRKMGAKVILYAEKENKYIKIVTHLKAIWKDLIFVDGTDKEYIEQICDYFEDAEHDDAPDDAACLARLLYPKREGAYQSIYM
jgi:hypothetical protein